MYKHCGDIGVIEDVKNTRDEYQLQARGNWPRTARRWSFQVMSETGGAPALHA